jgi:hypothetical protein
MMQAFQVFVGEPLQHRRFDLAWYRLLQLLHVRTNGAIDAGYMKLARLLQPKVALPSSTQMNAQKIRDVVERLRREGYMILPDRLPMTDVEAITSFAFSTPAIGANLNNAIQISRDHIPEGEARYYWWMDQLAAVPAVQRLITEGPYCAIAQEYLGCRPILVHISLFLDRPYEGHYEPYSYHCDNEGPGFLKFFFFLTDVAIGTGAHYFMAGTQAHTKPKLLPGGPFYKEQDLYNYYGRDREIIVQGPAGTVLAEDTAGFHRGSTISRGFRLMMQFEFSAIDVPTEQELARKLVPNSVVGLHPGLASIARKFYIPARR